jgi:putative membrane protein
VRYPTILLGLLVALFAGLAISPPDRLTWALENALVVAGVSALVATHRRLRFSNLSYTLIFVFLVLHEIGAYYTYTLVPYDRWWESLTGRTLSEVFGWERNHYDRLAHFAFGALLALPIRELVKHVFAARGALGFALPVVVALAWSASYELVEWVAALSLGEGTGAAYVGTQGDEWDAQKDMALALGGAVLAMVLAALAPKDRARGGGSARD